MFYLFRFHHWEPERYYSQGYGGRDLTEAFASLEAELREEARAWQKK